MNWRGVLIGTGIGAACGAGVVWMMNQRDAKRFKNLRKLHEDYEHERLLAEDAVKHKSSAGYSSHTENAEILLCRIIDYTRAISGLPSEHRAKNKIKQLKFQKELTERFARERAERTAKTTDQKPNAS